MIEIIVFGKVKLKQIWENTCLKRLPERKCKRLSRFAILDTRYAILDTKQTVLDKQYAIPETQYAILDTQYAILDTKYALLDTKYAILDTQYATPCLHQEGCQEWSNEKLKIEQSLFWQNLTPQGVLYASRRQKKNLKYALFDLYTVNKYYVLETIYTTSIHSISIWLIYKM